MTPATRRPPIATTLALLASFALPAHAADADFESTFDLDGRRIYSIDAGRTESNAHVFNGANGMRWVIGRSRLDASNARVLTLRVNGVDGTLIRHGGSSDGTLLQVKAAAPTPDGGAVALVNARGAATGEVDVRLLKFDAIGAVDTAFIGQGNIQIDFSNDPTPSALDLEVDPVGGIHMLYRTSDGGYMIHYAGPTGSSQTARKLAPTLGFTSAQLGMAPDGTLLVAHVTVDTMCRLGVMRFLPNPGPYAQDGTFDQVALAPAPCNVELRDVHVDRAGRVVMLARTEGSSYHFVRYLSNGRADTSFGGDGRADLSVGTADIRFQSIAVQSDGRVVASGSAFVTPGEPLSEQVAVARLTASGDPDASFAGGSYGRYFRFVDGSNTAAYTNVGSDLMIDPTNDRVVIAAIAVFGSADFALASLSGSPRLFGDGFE